MRLEFSTWEKRKSCAVNGRELIELLNTAHTYSPRLRHSQLLEFHHLDPSGIINTPK